MSQRILICDSYYPEVIRALPVDPSLGYEDNLKKTLGFSFGTADFYSRNLRELGWDACDVIANHEPLQKLWASEHGSLSQSWAVLEAQTADFAPNVIFMQDLSLDPPNYGPRLLAGQCSCPWPGDEQIRQYDAVFTSFPHYVERIRALGVKATYLALAFEHSVLEGPQPDRDIDISFVGGVGRNSHWKAGTDLLEAVAQAFGERFHWYGYGLDSLPASSALRGCYRGEAWGNAMYNVYRRSKIVVNRHGEVSDGFANNLRVFEVTGCGALLLTEGARNLRDFFYGDEVATYSSAKDAVNQIRHFLDDEQDRKWVASKGQKRTLAQHTYKQRMQVVSETLKGML